MVDTAETSVNNKTVRRDIISYAFKTHQDFYPSLTKSTDMSAKQSFYINDDMDTLAIVVNFGEDDGFVIFSDDSAQLPLAVADAGNFESYLEMPGMELLINNTLADYYSTSSLDPTVPSYMETITLSRSDTLVHPMVETRWHQREPFNLFATNSTTKLAGCTPIAIAQVMSYYKYPSTLDLTYPNATASYTSLDWDSMISHTGSHGTSCDICLQCAHLARQIGHICNATYNPTSTGAWPEEEYLNELGYSTNVYYDYSFNNIINSLKTSKPCILSAFSSSSGHTWVIDGYYNKTNIKRNFIVSGNIRTLYRTTQDIDTYLHFNYGWNNEYADIYILSNRYRTVTENSTSSEGVSSNPISIFDAPYDYNDVRRLLTDIQPLTI